MTKTFPVDMNCLKVYILVYQFVVIFCTFTPLVVAQFILLASIVDVYI